MTEKVLTKQEGIREHAIVDLMKRKGFDRYPTEFIVDYVLQSLDLDGVVIKVERELPEDCISCLTGENRTIKSVWINQDKLKEAGYVAVEPLI